MDPLVNPLPASIQPGPITVELTEYAQLEPGLPTFFRNYINFTYHSGDDTGRMYSAESEGGRVWIVEPTGEVLPDAFLDLDAIYSEGLADGTKPQGLRTFAFHPDYHIEGADGEGKFYTMATMHAETAQAGVETHEGPFEAIFYSTVTEWTVDPNNPDRIDPTSARELIRIAEPQFNHNSEQLMFDPNAQPGDADYGKLYISVSDGILENSPPDPFEETQDTLSIRGKIIRIDPLEQANGDAFGIPNDNPFIGDADVLPHIWAIGFRHPENMTFDTGGTGRMIITDIGQRVAEEVNIGVAGGNYGWSHREGTFSHSPDGASYPTDNSVYDLPADDASYGYTYPVAQYGRGEGALINGNPVVAIVGGYVYRDTDVPELFGAYLFGDIISGKVYYVFEENLVLGQQAEIRQLNLTIDGEPVDLLQIMIDEQGSRRADLRFAQNSDGEVFLTSKQNGKIYKLNPVDDDEPLILFGTPEIDTLIGHGGDDQITGLGEDDMIHAGGGDDQIFWHEAQGNDVVNGGDGQDTQRFNFNTGLRDVITVEVIDGDAVLSRSNFDPFSVTMTGIEIIDIQAKGGNDLLIIDNVEDAGVTQVVYRGSDGNDQVRNKGGTSVDMYANGGDGDDFLNAAHGNDILVGGDGDDIMFGRNGNDKLFGQGGNDIMEGGGLRDLFVFASGDGDDTINDFLTGVDDIRFNGVSFGFADLTFTDQGADLLLETPDGDSILLVGLAGDTLASTDFIFG